MNTMKRSFGVILIIAMSALLVRMMLLETSQSVASPPRVSTESGELDVGLGSGSLALRQRLAVAHDRLRRGTEKVQQAHQVLSQDEQRQKRPRPAAVELKPIENWEDWRPSVDSWFKTAGETDEEFAKRLAGLEVVRQKTGVVAVPQRPEAGDERPAARISNRLYKLRFGTADGTKLQLRPAFKPEVQQYSVYVDATLDAVEMLAETGSTSAQLLVSHQPVTLPRSVQPLKSSSPAEKLTLRVHLDDEGSMPDTIYTVTFWKTLPPGSPAGDYITARRNRGKECQRSSHCNGQQLCVWGKCRCPVLYSKKVAGGCSPTEGLREWCLKPLGGVELSELFDATHVGTVEEVAESSGFNAPAYSRQLAISRYFKGVGSRSHDLLLHAGNKVGKDLVMAFTPPAAAQGAARRGSGNNKPRVLPHDLQDSSWGIDWGRCAVVGGSNSLTGTQLGAIIDDHTAVIRVGDHPTVGHELDVGQRTSARRQSPETAGFSEGRGEAGQQGHEICIVNVRSFKGGELRSSSLMAKCTYVELSPQFEQYLRYYWRVNKPAEGGVKVSTWSPEFTAMALALHLCGQVNVFGLRAGAGQPPYSLNIASLADSANAGNEALEASCLQELRARRVVSVFK